MKGWDWRIWLKHWRYPKKIAGRWWEDVLEEFEMSLREFWSGKNIHGARLMQMNSFFLRMGPSACRSNYGEVG